jgi:protein-S-isoprenylcysteine O-methyltransferase Ste14
VVLKDDARRRSADTHRQAGAEAYHNGSVPLHRNPGYLALAMIYAGIAVLRNSLWAVLLLPLVVMVMQREVIGREERYLERAFGEEYLDYKARTRRWL